MTPAARLAAAASVLDSIAHSRQPAEVVLKAWGAALYFWARVAYIPLYAFGVPYIRSLVWLVSLAGLILIFAALFI